jgi:hypothetical protein
MLPQLPCSLLQCIKEVPMTAAAKTGGLGLIVWTIRVRA